MDIRRDNGLWLPTSAKEVKARGWDYVDVILFSGDAYVDHPSFGAAVIGRVLEREGYRVAIVPQPNWRDDLRDFKKLGAPRLFFGVSAGAMDSMVNHYTAAKRLRSDDAYTPGGRHGMRPDYPTIVYSKILKDLFPHVPILAGGIEASLRRLSHYDYWSDALKPSILLSAPIDLLTYGMGEKATIEIARRLDAGESVSTITDVAQTALTVNRTLMPLQTTDDIILNSWESCLHDSRLQSGNFKHIEQQSNMLRPRARLWQQYAAEGKAVLVNPMWEAMKEGEIDASFDLPYTRQPHPRYMGKTIPAYEMIRHSVNMHRGCFGGCAFCTISAHQGKHIASRSPRSIIEEVRKVARMDDFKGYVSDLGGPSANMYGMRGRDLKVCERCMRPSCLHPAVCRNLDTSHAALLEIYRRADSVEGVKKTFVGSGVRYDLSMHHTGDPKTDKINAEYNRELIARHVSGRLKVAPEHTEPHVLNLMRKPGFEKFEEFKRVFDRVNSEEGLRQQIIPYFISSHPGCREEDMAQLAVKTKGVNVMPEQIQDFTPTPMTLASEIYYSGVDPYTGKTIYTAVTPEEKLIQRRYFFWWDKTYRRDIESRLRKIGRMDLALKLFGKR